MTQSYQSMSLHFSPSIDPPWLWLIALIGGALFLLSLFRYKRGAVVRFLVFLVFMAALMGPSLLKEERNSTSDVAAIVLDTSESQKIGKRAERSQKALEYIQNELRDTNTELRIIEAPRQGEVSSRTDLFGALDQALADIPQKRRAGVIFLTDGQVHDVPKQEGKLSSYGPVHVLLSGERNEKDRQIVITKAPAYGLVGKDVTVKYRIEDTKNIGKSYANITVTLHDGTERHISAPVGKEQRLTLPIDHASQNVFSMQVDAVDGELTLANNKAAVLVNGVRDRLKVLLISGIPHAGERTWRDLLTSDPGVDLVHFTILREPKKFDYTPKNELSLIAFPFRELFEVKLYDFDLIIFDRYRVNNILPDKYFRNIVEYVKKGGAFLAASGPEFIGNRSIYKTPLGEILPGKPGETVMKQKFTPRLSELGGTHPVTKSLIWNNTIMTPDTAPVWGAWLRQLNTSITRGDTLMHGINNAPLLTLDHVDAGRVAQISSDHIWLWSRGYDGGGPHAELLRKIVHWLMKEPELDERALNVSVHKNTITLEKPAYNTTKERVTLTLPDNTVKELTLKLADNNLLTEKYTSDQLGIHAFEDKNHMRKFAIIGELNPPELRALKTTRELMSPLVEASNGTFIMLEDVLQPRISFISDNARRFGGSNWLALRQNNDFTVTSVKDTPLLPEWLSLILLLCILISLWWREGKST